VSPRTPFFVFWCPYARCGCSPRKRTRRDLDNSCRHGSSSMWTPTRCRSYFCFGDLNGPPSPSPDLPHTTDPARRPDTNPRKNCPVRGRRLRPPDVVRFCMTSCPISVHTSPDADEHDCHDVLDGARCMESTDEADKAWWESWRARLRWKGRGGSVDFGKGG
jgi:hypothetical protein